MEAYPQINKMASFRVFSTKEYAKFGAKIAEALRSCVRPVLDQCALRFAFFLCVTLVVT